ncbi:tryptophan synthase subunit alpha [Marinilabiliaceae bacterium JC017]|nr:tryptophan synthase subunit alpha [Marinilabiliaceae bacterium JC017]
MNRIAQLFKEKKNILSIYYTAGFPQLTDTLPILETLEKAGADLVEIGMPFSDPLADGPTIQQSGQTALKNGMTINLLFEQLADLRPQLSIPVILMGYFNPVHKFGMERFVEQCRKTGVDGVIIPDLPFDEYREKYEALFTQAGISNIFLITPQTPEERIKLIDKNSNGFIYMVSSASVTGTKKEISEQQTRYFKRINNMQLASPRLIGFGISDRASFQKACDYAAGAIVGSAFINLLNNEGNNPEKISDFIQSIKKTN